jgi:hypothetical protein
MGDPVFAPEAEWTALDFAALRALLEAGSAREVVFNDREDSQGR